MGKIKIIGYHRKGYRRKGKSIPSTEVRGHLRKDLGAPGKTPKAQRWFKPKRKLGWEKDMPQEKRIAIAVASRPKGWSEHKRVLSASRALGALANVTTDPETKRLAKQDAAVLRRRL